MEAMDWGQLVSTIGFPITLVGVICFALWRAMVWFAPHVAKLVEAHITFLGSIQASVQSLKESSERTIQSVGFLAERFENLAEQISKRDERVEELLRTIATRPCLLSEKHKGE